MNKGFKADLAILSSTFATGGNVLAKLAGYYEFSDAWSALTKSALLVCMVTSNTIGMTMFAKALAGSGSSVPVTVTTSSLTYVSSALIGMLLFEENLSIQWWCGTSFVLIGLLLICQSSSTKEQDRKNQ